MTIRAARDPGRPEILLSVADMIGSALNALATPSGDGSSAYLSSNRALVQIGVCTLVVPRGGNRAD
jgi:hypothetical protein